MLENRGEEYLTALYPQTHAVLLKEGTEQQLSGDPFARRSSSSCAEGQSRRARGSHGRIGAGGKARGTPLGLAFAVGGSPLRRGPERWGDLHAWRCSELSWRRS